MNLFVLIEKSPVTPSVPATVTFPRSAASCVARPMLIVVAFVPPMVMFCAPVASITSAAAAGPAMPPVPLICTVPVPFGVSWSVMFVSLPVALTWTGTVVAEPWTFSWFADARPATMVLSTSRPPVVPTTRRRPVPFGATLIPTLASLDPVELSWTLDPVAAPATTSWFPAFGPNVPLPCAVRLPVAAATVSLEVLIEKSPVTPSVPATVTFPRSAAIWVARPMLIVVAFVPPRLIGCAPVSSMEKLVPFDPSRPPATVVLVASTLNCDALFACRSMRLPVYVAPVFARIAVADELAPRAMDSACDAPVRAVAVIRAIVPPVAVFASMLRTPVLAVPA